MQSLFAAGYGPLLGAPTPPPGRPHVSLCLVHPRTTVAPIFPLKAMPREDNRAPFAQPTEQQSGRVLRRVVPGFEVADRGLAVAGLAGLGRPHGGPRAGVEASGHSRRASGVAREGPRLAHEKNVVHPARAT